MRAYDASRLIGVTMMTIPGMWMFVGGFLVSTLWCAFVRYRSGLGYLLWALAIVINLPALIFVIRVAVNDQRTFSDFDYGIFFVLLLSGGLGVGWLAGCLFGLFIRIATVGTRTTLQ